MKSPLLSLALAAVWAQSPPPPVISPEVHADRRVTFRLRDPGAKEVFVSREDGQRLAMQKDEQGVWSVTTDPLEPDFYGYSFIADGVSLLDPVNPLMKPNLLNTTSMVHVRGEGLTWETGNVPRGMLHRVLYLLAVGP